MSTISVTYSFTNATAADATQVNTNFQDIINGTSDGTKDFTINSLTTTNDATVNGNTTLGNSTVDTLTINASLAASIPVGTTNAYDIGSATLGLRSIYLGANSHTTRLVGSASMSSTWTFTLPVTVADAAGYALKSTNTSGGSKWESPSVSTINAISGDYVITTTDGYEIINVTTGSATVVVTLPAVASSSGRRVRVTKADTGTGKWSMALTDGSFATSAGVTYIGFAAKGCAAEFYCDGSVWHIPVRANAAATTTSTFTFDGSGGTSGSSPIEHLRIDNFVYLFVTNYTATTGTGSVNFTSNTALPVWCRPATTPAAFPVDSIRNNAATQGSTGHGEVSTGGIITFNRDATGSAFANSASAGLTRPVSMIFNVGPNS